MSVLGYQQRSETKTLTQNVLLKHTVWKAFDNKLRVMVILKQG
jgi:hypothetical protein